MITVAIIGLLSSVALPNFRKFQARSKTAEAKLQLSTIFTAEQSFFADHGMYSNCLRYMGFDPSDERPQRYYLVGFPHAIATIHSVAYNSAVNSGLSTQALEDGGCPNSASSTEGQTYFLPGKSLGDSIATLGTVPGAQSSGGITLASSMDSGFYPAAQAGVGEQSAAATMTFRAVASGFIEKNYCQLGTTPTVMGSSIFSINQRKQFFNPRTGY